MMKREKKAQSFYWHANMCVDCIFYNKQTVYSTVVRNTKNLYNAPKHDIQSCEMQKWLHE